MENYENSKFVTGFAKNWHNDISLNFQYKPLIAMGKIFV